ncbi:MAG TPA: ATP-binding protein [Syntrophorhabdaceae bacterium]|nr:ATP-binding protein [Syntrophorhabdaceae bacterium]HOT42648.1 ATP-binding protein [Syntrophorhabdaceae bacterium]HPP41244.1 ATP-binding protein [Syntrophorhabdaceae bacterium]
MRISIFTKNMGAFLIVVLLLGLSMPFIAFKTIKQHYIATFTDNLKNMTLLLRPEITDFFRTRKLKEMDNYVKSFKHNVNMRITVMDSDGLVIADSEKDPRVMENHRMRPEFIDAVSGRIGKSMRFSVTVEEKMLYVAVPIVADGKIIGVLRISEFLKDIENLLNDLRNKIIWLTLITATFAFIITLIISRGISKPLAELVLAAKQVSQGNFNVKVFLKNNDELKDLAESFNEMTIKMQNMFQHLANQKEEFNTIISSIEEPLFVLKKDGTVKLCNESFKRIADNRELKGGYFWEYCRSPELDDIVKKVKLERKHHLEEIKIKDRFYLCSFTFLNQTEEIVIILQDITRFKQLETLKKEFIANISHELRTPLTAIKGFIETLEEEEHIQNVRYLEAIKRHTNRLMNIVNDILVLSELEKEGIRLEKEDVNLIDLTENILKIFEQRIKEKGLSVVLNAQENIRPIKADSFRLEQMLINLMDNAIKYTEKGTITISINQDEDICMITVEDTGIGIPESSIPRIFERFYTADKSRSKKLGGTGLGLSIVKHIVLLHKGSIDVQSSFGKGTKFTIKLPM